MKSLEEHRNRLKDDHYYSGKMTTKEKEKDPYPICPINLYFEGDENVCNADLCDWDWELRLCHERCKILKTKDIWNLI